MTLRFRTPLVAIALASLAIYACDQMPSVDMPPNNSAPTTDASDVPTYDDASQDSNQPTCTSETPQQFCSGQGRLCGIVSGTDNCGFPITVASCGTCILPAICNGDVGQCQIQATDANACTPETDSQLCSNQAKFCGSITATDNCGGTRTIANCGTCTLPAICTVNTCCTPETDQQLCNAQGKLCGSLTAIDNCGTQRTANCGVCPVDAGVHDAAVDAGIADAADSG